MFLSGVYFAKKPSSVDSSVVKEVKILVMQTFDKRIRSSLRNKMKIVIGLVVVILMSMPCLHCQPLAFKLNVSNIKVSLKVLTNYNGFKVMHYRRFCTN